MAKHVCPVWIGYMLASPLRKLWQHPRKILSAYVTPGMVVLDIGCAMGFFSLPLASLVGPGGEVICVDIQEPMINSLAKRARRGGLSNRIELRVCDENTLGLGDLAGQIDFAFVFAVVHEVPDASRLFTEVRRVLKPGGKALVAEPKAHVSKKDFANSIGIAEEHGLVSIEGPRIAWSRSALMERMGENGVEALPRQSG